MNNTIPSHAKLAKAVEEFFGVIDWTFDLGKKLHPHHTFFHTSVEIQGGVHPVFIETDEKSETIQFFIYSSFNIPVHRIPEFIKLSNHLNWHIPIGRYAIADNGRPARMQWKAMIDVEGSKLSVAQVRTLQRAGCIYFEKHFEIFSRLAFTSCTMKDLWEDTFEEDGSLTKAKSTTTELIPQQL